MKLECLLQECFAKLNVFGRFFSPQAVTEICSINVNSWNYVHSVEIVGWVHVHMHCLRVDSYFLSILTFPAWGGYEKAATKLLPRLCFVVFWFLVLHHFRIFNNRLLLES